MFEMELYLGRVNKSFCILSESVSVSEQCGQFCILSYRTENRNRKQLSSVWPDGEAGLKLKPSKCELFQKTL